MRARSTSLAGFDQDAQVRERVLHLGALVELHARRRSGRARSPRAAPLRARATGRGSGRRRRSRAGPRPRPARARWPPTTNAASSRSSRAATTRMGAPSSFAVHSSLGSRSLRTRDDAERRRTTMRLRRAVVLLELHHRRVRDSRGGSRGCCARRRRASGRCSGRRRRRRRGSCGRAPGRAGSGTAMEFVSWNSSTST